MKHRVVESMSSSTADALGKKTSPQPLLTAVETPRCKKAPTLNGGRFAQGGPYTNTKTMETIMS